MVLHHDGEMVTRSEPRLAEQTGKPDGAVVELAVGDDLAAATHDDRPPLRIEGRDRPGVGH